MRICREVTCLLKLSAVALVSLLTACATTVANLPAEINPQRAAQSVSLPPDRIISIRFPVQATPAARQQLVSNYTCGYNRLIDHNMTSCGMPGFTSEFAPMLFEQSTYYAAELKAILARYLATDSVRLEPQLLDYKKGQYIQASALAATTPSILVLDLYDFAQSVKVSIGAGYTPHINLKTAADVSPATCGNLLASPKHHKLDAEQVKQCAGLDARATPGGDPLQHFLKSRPELVSLPQHTGSPIQLGSVLAQTMVWEKNDDAYLEASSQEDYAVSADSIQNATSDWIARLMLSGLDVIDQDAAFEAGFGSYIKDFDPALAQRHASKQLAGKDASKVDILKKLLAVENDWAGAQNQAITDGILNGPYGRSFRQTRLLLAQGYGKSQTLSWLNAGAMLAGGFSSGLFGGAGAYNPTMLMTQTLQSQQLFAGEQQKIEDALLTALSPGIDMRSQAISVSINGVSAKIQGESHEQIRTQLKALYKKLARA